MCQTFIWEIPEVNKEAQNSRKEVRLLIQQTMVNGPRHARGPIPSFNRYINNNSKISIFQAP